MEDAQSEVGSRMTVMSCILRQMDDALRAEGSPCGFHQAHLFPVEGDSAIVELWHNDEVWADVRLEELRLDASGEDRLTSATAVVRLYPRPAGMDPDWHEYSFDEILAELNAARDWLVDNERGRVLEQGDEDLSAAGRALSKASTLAVERFIGSVPPAAQPEPPNAGAGDLTVIIVDEGPTPITLIRELRRLTGYGLRDARDLLENRPSVVMTGLSAIGAAKVRQTLEAAGATVEIR